MYFLKRVEGQVVGEEVIHPGKWVDDLLVFEEPVEQARRLVLGLAGENVSGRGLAWMTVPRERRKRE